MDHAKKYLRENRIKKAQLLFEKAHLISTNEIEVLSGLSEINLRLWQQFPEEEKYSSKAIFYAERCLKIQPEHEASLTRLAVLKPRVEIYGVSRNAKMIALMARLVAMLIAGLILFFMSHTYYQKNAPIEIICQCI